MAPGAINRHSGLRVDGLKRRYLRRHERPADTAPPGDDEDPGDCGVPCPCQDCAWEAVVDEEMQFALWAEELWTVGRSARLGDRLQGRSLTAAPGQATAGARVRPGAELMEALREHASLVAQAPLPPDLVHGERFQPAWREIAAGGTAFHEVLPLLRGHIGALVTALLFAPLWVRPLAAFAPQRTRRPADLVAALVEHLFVGYPVPPFLVRAWTTGEAPGRKWVLWTILLGQGASLHCAAPRFGWVVSQQLQRHLFAAPPDLSPIEACMWAEIARLGGSGIELDRLCKYVEEGAGPYVLDPTDAPDGEGAARLQHWRQTVAWLARHRDGLTDESCGEILDWAMHRYTEGLARGEPFRWSGRTLRAAQREADEYRRQCRSVPYVHACWSARGWDWEFAAGDEEVWTVRELTSAEQLYEEGMALGHCVAGYAGRCVSGGCAIFSLRMNGRRRITVEVSPGDRRILQARGTRNRGTRPDEDAVLQRWLQALRTSRA